MHSELKRKAKEQKDGITLIALVVTIVVLLILAGVSISMLTGENGIITQSSKAKEESEIGNEEEIVKLAASDAKSKSYTQSEGIITKQMLQDALDIITVTNKTTVEDVEPFIVRFNDTNREYYVSKDGNIIKPTDSNIFTYTEDGYITGIKEEYIYFEEETGALELKKYASLNQIKVAAVVGPKFRLLDENIGTILYIPKSINNTNIIGISDKAFYAIKNLTGVVMQDNIKTIGKDTFYFCKELYSVKLSNELTEIGDSAFQYCFELKEIDITNKVNKIGAYCFDNVGINDNVYIPISVNEIGEYAFSSVAFAKGTINCAASSKPEKWDENWNCIFLGRSNKKVRSKLGNN